MRKISFSPNVAVDVGPHFEKRVWFKVLLLNLPRVQWRSLEFAIGDEHLLQELHKCVYMRFPRCCEETGFRRGPALKNSV